MTKSTKQSIGPKKGNTATVASGMTSALEQKDLEKALIKGKLRGKADIEEAYWRAFWDGDL